MKIEKLYNEFSNTIIEIYNTQDPKNTLSKHIKRGKHPYRIWVCNLCFSNTGRTFREMDDWRRIYNLPKRYTQILVSVLVNFGKI